MKSSRKFFALKDILTCNQQTTEIKKIINTYNIKDINVKNTFEEKLMSKNVLLKINDKDCDNQNKWVVGLDTSGISCLVIIWLNENFIYNMENGHIYKLSSIFIDSNEFNKTIIKGTLSYKNESYPHGGHNTKTTFEEYFVSEQILVYKGESLIDKNFNDRWTILFNLKFNENNPISLVILTLRYVKYIKTLMKDLQFPFETNGLRFITPFHPESTYLWKRNNDIEINFKIKANDTSTEFVLLNCKKSSFTINNNGNQNKNKIYHDKVVKCLYFDNQWIISNVTDAPVSTQSHFKNIISFIKEHIELEHIYESIVHDL